MLQKVLPIVDSMNANAVPTGRPFRSRVSIIGIIPDALLYKGIPNITAAGIDHQAQPHLLQNYVDLSLLIFVLHYQH